MNGHDYFSEPEEQFSQMRSFLQSDAAKHPDLSGIEGFLFTDGRTLLRHLLQAHLAERGVGDVGANVHRADGVARTHKRLRSRTLKTLFGPIKIRRLGYSKPFVSSRFPLDAMLNLPNGKISDTLQRHVVLGVINKPFQESLEAIHRWTGVTITNEQAQRIVGDAAQEFLAFTSSASGMKASPPSRFPFSC